MNKPHKYAKAINHWANGGEIQYLPATEPTAWHDWMPEPDSDNFVDCPNFNVGVWRIKPNTKDFIFRVAIMQDDLDKPEYWPNCAFTKEEEKVIEGEGAFLKWLTDWKAVKDVEL